MKNYLIALLLGLTAFVYYWSLSADQWTWVFVSFDSGDWLAASHIWMVPQPYGSPLYLLLGHFLDMFSGDMVSKMTVFLSVIPASVTISVVYLTVKKLRLNDLLALTSVAVLLACSIFLSQATVLEEYAISAMFVSLAFYFYISDNRYLTILCLSLGSAIHIIVVPITVLWFVVNYRYWDSKRILIPMYLFIVGGFYSFILYLMASDAPNYIAGNLSLQSINAYLGSTGTIGRISLNEAPQRLWEAGRILCAGFGIALIPLIYGMRKSSWGIREPFYIHGYEGRKIYPNSIDSERIKRHLINGRNTIIVTVVFCFWLYLTNTDMTTWTFQNFAIPIAAVTVAIGLSRMPKWCTIAVLVCAMALIFTNSRMLNADKLTPEYSEAMTYQQTLAELPDDSAVALPKGGAYGLGLIYSISQGREFIPVFMQKEEGWDNPGYKDYIKWVKSDQDVDGDNWIEQIDYCLANDIPVYIGYVLQPEEWREIIDENFRMVKYNEYFNQINSKSSY